MGSETVTYKEKADLRELRRGNLVMETPCPDEA